MELTIGITAHNEGLIAHKTMRSVFRALKNYKGTYEIIVHIDSGTKETKAYFDRYEKNPKISVFHNSFKDIGESRNSIVQKAKGNYIIFLDADDLVSENYFDVMVSVIKNNKNNVVVHPECCLCFWEDYASYCLLWKGVPATSRPEAARLLFSRNRWPSACAGKRELFQKYPYQATADGYGHEDYGFNIELANAGVQHLIADHTILFYRQKASSAMRSNNARAVTQPYTELFDFNEWKHYAKADFQPAPDVKKPQGQSLKQRLLSTYVRARNNHFLNSAIEPLAKVARKLTGKKLIHCKHPDWLMREWKEVSKIELQLYPTPWLLEHVDEVSPDAEMATSAAYYQLCQNITSYPDYVFIVPWLVSGGADKVVINYLEALQEIHPDWKIAVITTLQADNLWANKLPANSFLLDFGNIAAGLHDEARDLLFIRLLIQLEAKKIHIVNSLYGYQWADRHADLVKSHMELYVSLFCHDIVPSTHGEGRFDYVDPYALRIYSLIKKVYTDNEAVINNLVENYAFDRDKIKVHYQPVALTSNADTNRAPIAGPLKLLWASRISAQKNPELLLEIAKKLDPNTAHIDVYGRRCPDCAHLVFPPTSQTITYCGEFNGLQSLDLSQYDLLLYTSRIDGVPNIVLESAGAGLPMIASGVGGVVDFVEDGKTGFLVMDADNADAYVDIINKIFSEKPNLSDISKQAFDRAKSRHSFEHFVDSVREDF